MLIETLLSSADKHADDLLVADMLGMELTYSRVVRLAAVMKGIVEKATNCPRVGMFLPSSAGFMITYYGIVWARRAAVPLNMLLRTEELAKIVQDAGLDTIVTLRFPEDTAHLNKTVDDLPVANRLYLNDLPLKRKVVASYLWRLPRPPRVEPEDVEPAPAVVGQAFDRRGVVARKVEARRKGHLVQGGPGFGVAHVDASRRTDDLKHLADERVGLGRRLHGRRQLPGHVAAELGGHREDGRAALARVAELFEVRKHGLGRHGGVAASLVVGGQFGFEGIHSSRSSSRFTRSSSALSRIS